MKKITGRALWMQLPNAKKAVSKVKRRIPVVSSRRRKLNRVYSVLRKKVLGQNWKCMRCLVSTATEVHHKFGRGPNLLNVSTWIPLCGRCHNWVHANPNRAREAGFVCPKGQWMVKQ